MLSSMKEELQDVRMKVGITLETGDGESIAAVELDRVFEDLFDASIPETLEQRIGSRFHHEVITRLRAGIRRFARAHVEPEDEREYYLRRDQTQSRHCGLQWIDEPVEQEQRDHELLAELEAARHNALIEAD